MKKKLITVLSIISCSFAAAPVITGCGVKKGEVIDSKKTQIYVNNFCRGFGGEWLTNYKKAFEALHEKDTQWQEGKVGVQIIINNSNAPAGTRTDKIKTDRDEVYFTEQTDYFALLKDDCVGDITEAVTTKIDGETKSIEDKMTEAQKNYLRIYDGGGDAHYYGIPHYSGYFGLTYDVDLFDDNKLYLDKTGKDLVVSLTEERYVGPDGVSGTSDDGLPATYEQFYTLCNAMINYCNITPLVASGACAQGYMDLFVNQLATQNMGAEQTQLIFSCDGEAKNLATVDDGGNVVPMADMTVTPQTGYNMYHAKGKYDAMKFFENIYKGTTSEEEPTPYFLNTIDKTTDSAGASHDHFLGSRIAGATTLTQPIAMIAEGNWWVNEATSKFDFYAQKYGDEYSKQNRRLAFMPLPKATLTEDKTNTVYDHLSAISFIKKGVAEWKMPLINEFLKFCNSDEALVSFTVTTNTMKALNYEIPETELNKMNYYGRSMYDLQKSATIVYPYNNTEFFRKNASKFKTTAQLVSTLGGTDYKTFFEALTAGYNAEQIFKGNYTYFKNDWSNYSF